MTGSFFFELTEDSVLAAVAACERLETSPEEIAQHARRFSRDAFRTRLTGIIRDRLEHRAHASRSNVKVRL